MRKPFFGTVTAQSNCNGSYKGTSRDKKYGRIKLSAFGMDPTGLDYNKSYFQATGKNYIYLVTNKPVIWNGQKTNKVRIQSGSNVIITVNAGENRQLEIKFESRIKGTSRPRSGGGTRKSTPKRSGRR